MSLLALSGAVLLWLIANAKWLHALAAVLYVVALLASVLARRDARVGGLRGNATDEK